MHASIIPNTTISNEYEKKRIQLQKWKWNKSLDTSLQVQDSGNDAIWWKKIASSNTRVLLIMILINLEKNGVK